MDFFNYDNKLSPQKGRLLISEPCLPDPNFERTVVLLCEHNQDGSFGFVLNKPSQVLVEDIIPEFKNVKEKVFIGGPVQQDTFHFIHRNDQLDGALPIIEGLFWGGNFEQIKVWATTGAICQTDYKFFVGYSGWAEGQLEEELEAGSWIVAESVEAEYIFGDKTEELWREVMKALGGRFNIYSNYPVDPRLN
ncbi:MAG: YqgE/AlgH family protein [Cyclobacteriaceae bacterium]|nr:YqgE/AlgH family protein [Cyclobacteriaceae bacterium]